MAVYKRDRHDNNELTLEQMIKKWKHDCERDTIIEDYRKHEYYVSPGQKKRAKRKKVIRAQRRAAEKQ